MKNNILKSEIILFKSDRSTYSICNNFFQTFWIKFFFQIIITGLQNKHIYNIKIQNVWTRKKKKIRALLTRDIIIFRNFFHLKI